MRRTAVAGSESGAVAEDGTAARGLPSKRQAGRQVVILLGAAEPGLALLSRALQALGVDMLEAEHGATKGDGAADIDDGDGYAQSDWRRPWVADLNGRMLAAIGRQPEHFAHALPFPPGWWRRPRIQALKREAMAAVEAALEGHDELWGFADLATARLLPVWEDVFERLGLTPAYVWSLTPPASVPALTGADPVQAAAAAEVRWFAYGADIYRYGADHLACVVDEAEWRTDPQALMESLVGRLRLHWRGTRLDLYETVGAVLAEGIHAFGEDTVARPAALPLSTSFFRSAQALGGEEDADARRRLEAVVESAELLRPLIAPFLPALDAKDRNVKDRGGADQGEDPAVLRQEIAALRETCAALKATLQTVEPAPAPSPAHSDGAEEHIEALELELEARRAEIRWLHDRHAADLQEVEQEIAALRASPAPAMQTGGSSPAAQAGSPAEMQQAQAEVARLQAEMANLTTANERYLARIYELKKALEDHGAFERAGR